jgi:UDP-glucose 4-epimerase
MREVSRALVVGGAGFIGSRLVRILCDRGVETTVIDDLSSGFDVQVNGAELIVADVRQAGLEQILREREIDAIFHLANGAYVPPSLQWPIDDLERNTVTTLAVLEAVRRLDKPPVIVYASSAAVYGDAQHMPMGEEHPIEPKSPYGVSKFASEQYVRLYANLYATPSLSARLFSVYGPGQRKQVVFDLMSRAFGGELPLTVLGSPDVSRDFVFVEDAARAFVTLASAAPAHGEAYNIASGTPTTLAVLVSTLLSVGGLDVPVRFTGQVRPGDPLHWEGDPERARRLGVACDTSLADGIRRTVEWFLEAVNRPAASRASFDEAGRDVHA